MKKLTKIFGLVVITVLTVIMAVCFAACGDGEKREEWETYAGTYKFSKMETTIQGSYAGTPINQTVSVNAGESYGGVTYEADSMVIELKSDGKAELKSAVSNVKSESNLNWYVEDNKLMFKEMSSEGIDYIISESNIEFGVTVTTSGMTTTIKYILAKV